MQIEKSFDNRVLELPFSRWRFIDLIYPPFCCNCGKIGYEICPNCFKELELTIHKNICLVCGITIRKGLKCSNCRRFPSHFEQLRSWGVYAGVLKQVVKKIKYNRGFGIIEYIIQPIIQFIKNWDISVNMIIPIPLSKNREAERGYNQSVLLAEPISKSLNIPFQKHALIRTRDTKSQVGLKFAERKTNIKNAFQANKSLCENRSILLIDDIATTCSTLNECAKVLKLAEAREVICFTVARTKNSDKMKKEAT